MRTFVLTALIVLTLHGVGNAQVAAPSILPAAPSIAAAGTIPRAGFVTVNPAALQWGAPSRIGFGGLGVSMEVDGEPAGDLSGGYGGFRAVGTWAALAVEGVGVEPEDESTSDLRSDSAHGGLSFHPWEPLAVGGGYSHQQVSETQTVIDPFTGFPLEADLDLAVTSRYGGVGLRLGQGLFLGAVGGTDHVRVRTALPGFTDEFTAGRNFSAYGAALRQTVGLPLHLEYYVARRASFVRETGSGTQKFGDVRSSVGVIELSLGGFVLGYRGVYLDEEERGERAVTRADLYDVGWAPFQGFSLVVHNETAHTKRPATDTEPAVGEDTTVWAVTVAWQF